VCVTFSGRDTRRVGDDKGGHPLVAAGAGGGEAGGGNGCWAGWARRKAGPRCGGAGRGLLAAAG
jgi:hypothetical protein